MILAGLEWNVPPRGGDEHATLLVPPGPQEWATLAEFKDRFDDYDLGDRPKPDAAEALRWLAGRSEGDSGGPLVVYNHPSRKDASSMDNVADLEAWTAVNDVVVGFEGRAGPPGRPSDRLVHRTRRRPSTGGTRWRPGPATRGTRCSSAASTCTARSPHRTSTRPIPGDLNDYWPCQFSETWLYVPERTPTGVLRALRAGTFFGAHGRIAREVELTVNVDGLPRPAIAGETIEVPAGTAVTVSLRFSVPERDWKDEPNRIDAVEFIVITPAAVRVLSQAVTGTGPQVVSQTVDAGEGWLRGPCSRPARRF